MTGAVVVDASVAVKWLVPEERSEDALSLAKRWAQEGIITLAPMLLWSEVGNALHQRVRSGELETSDAARLLGELGQLGLEPRSEVHICPRAMHLANEFGLTNAYDAVYLALAEAEDAEFWTADGPLYKTVGRQLEWVHSLGENK